MAILRILLLLGIGLPVAADLEDLGSDEGTKVIRPLTCKDILFGTFSLDADPSLQLMLMFNYTNCIMLLALEDQLSRAADPEKAKLQQDIKTIQDFLSPGMLAFRLAPFVFGNTKLREQLDEAIQNRPQE